MIETYQKNLNLINSPVTIQDILVTGNHSGEAGEYADASAEVSTQKSRLYKQIACLAKMVEAEHLQRNFDKSLSMKKGKSNAITRLVTNELVFYTRKPLSLADFGELMQSINALAKKLPQNLHFVLSSFAVQTPDSKVMNVVAQVECGVKPKLSLIVKNKSSPLDPVYSENVKGRKVTLPNVNQKNDQVDHYKITVDGKSVPFSFKNVTECETAGGAKFHLCIDMCLDHFFGVAKKCLDNNLKMADNVQGAKDLRPSQCSHIVTSNAIKLYSKYSIGNVTHADPLFWREGIKEGAYLLRENKIRSTFGSDLRAFITSPTICSKLPSYEQSLVDAYNNKVLIGQRSTKSVVVKSKVAPKLTVTSDKSNGGTNCVKPRNKTALPTLIADLDAFTSSTTACKLPEKPIVTTANPKPRILSLSLKSTGVDSKLPPIIQLAAAIDKLTLKLTGRTM